MLAAAKQLQASLATVAAAQQPARARSAFEDLPRLTLRTKLYQEQHHLCIYCEGRVHEKRTPPVEHWDPVKHAPQRALDWDNLYLSCPTPATCDGAKHDTPLGLPAPAHLDYEYCLGVTSRGELYVRSDAPLTPVQRAALAQAIGTRDPKAKSTLNLNTPVLCEARMAAMDGESKRLAKDFPGTTATRSERRDIADRLLRAGKRPEYVSSRVAYLNRALGQARPP